MWQYQEMSAGTMKKQKTSVCLLALVVLSACDPVHFESYHFVDVSEYEKEKIIHIIYEIKAKYGCDNDTPSNMRVCGGTVYFDPKTSMVSLSQLPSESWGKGFRTDMKRFSEKLYARLQREFPGKMQVAK